MAEYLIERRNSLTRLSLLFTVSLVALAIRYPLRHFISGDMRLELAQWFNYILLHGRWLALGDNFANYTPPYTYLLVLATYLDGIVAHGTAIKLISIVFDFFAAFTMYHLVRLNYPQGWVPVLAFASVLLAPTVIVNSAMWGQCDVIYSAFLLVFVYFCLICKPLLAILCFAVAFAFKAQAMFLAPFLFLLMLRKQIPWTYLLFVPAVYLIAILPPALLGRSFWDLLTIYAKQGMTYHELWMGASNLYYYIPNQHYVAGSLVGIAITLSAVFGYLIVGARSRVAFDRILLLKAATLSAVLLPTLLPKMHDRYFFPADLLTIALAFFVPRFWFLPLAFQLISLQGYSWFLLGRPLVPMGLAVFLNVSMTLILAVVYIRALQSELRPVSSSAAQVM